MIGVDITAIMGIIAWAFVSGWAIGRFSHLRRAGRQLW